VVVSVGCGGGVWRWWRQRCGGDDDGRLLVDVVVMLEWQRGLSGGGDREARDGEWCSRSDRSGGGEHFWTRPENSPEKFFGGGGS
ncbi:hypothetical protein Tco_1098931, partial [Tanacetum coccineum]